MQDKKTNRTWVPEAMLYSKTIKAGRRVYYIDVKQDSKDEYYLSITESKRTQEGSRSEERRVAKLPHPFLRNTRFSSIAKTSSLSSMLSPMPLNTSATASR